MADSAFDCGASAPCADGCMAKPSAWVMRFAGLIPRAGSVLDVACGEGRHTAYLLLKGFEVTAVDRDLSRVEAMASAPGLTLESRDLESEPWPYGPDAFDAIVVTNFLCRAHFPYYFKSLKPGGVFIMETFTKANGLIWGRPKNPEHYLVERELFELAPKSVHIIAYEEGMTLENHAVERIVWTKPSAAEPYGWALGAR